MINSSTIPSILVFPLFYQPISHTILTIVKYDTVVALLTAMATVSLKELRNRFEYCLDCYLRFYILTMRLCLFYSLPYIYG